MNVLVINGSPRLNGATGILLQEFAERLREKGELQVDYVDLSKIKMEFCRGCEACYRVGGCVVQDDMEELVKKIRQTDGLVLGTPTYGSNVSGHMKVLIDRGHFVMEQKLLGKMGFALSTYENAAGKSALNVLKRLILFSGGINQSQFLLKIDHNSNPMKQKGVREKIRQKADEYYQAIINQQKKPFVQRILHGIIYRVGLRPRVMKHPQQYAGVLNEWKTLGLYP